MGKKKLAETKNYYTHDNGGRPYKVSFFENNVWIYDNDTNKLITELLSDKIFIGKSIENKMTNFSGGFGDKFDGNSIILEFDNKYKFIGHKIFNFITLCPIKIFSSPVGNNDVPYPYAIDENDNIYLLIENVILINHNLNLEDINLDPYEYYYRNCLITKDLGINNFKKYHPDYQPFNNIAKYFIGEDQYTFRYYPDPDEEYDRLSQMGQIKIVFEDNTEKLVDKQMYNYIMNDFGSFKGFQRLNTIFD